MPGSEWISVAAPSEPFLRQTQEYKDVFERVLNSGIYIQGPELSNFESEFANFLGMQHAIGVANGTDAIALALKALNIGPGDEVITVSHTAVATVAAVEQIGATPILVDIEKDCYSIDTSLMQEVLSSKTRAVLAVHLYGNPADLGELLQFCKANDLFLVEDCSQAHGAVWKNRLVGTLGDVATFSFYPTKNLGAMGDAGMVVTRSTEIADRVRRLSQYGWQERNVSLEPGQNSRLDEIQAGILRIRLRSLREENDSRISIAKKYSAQVDNQMISLPSTRDACESVFHLYVIAVTQREDLVSHLKEHRISSAVHYPVPIHVQPSYLGRIRTSRSMEKTIKASEEVLSIPMHPYLTDVQIERVCSALQTWKPRRG